MHSTNVRESVIVIRKRISKSSADVLHNATSTEYVRYRNSSSKTRFRPFILSQLHRSLRRVALIFII